MKIIVMMPFSTGTGLKRVGIAGPELAMLLGRSASSGCGSGTPLPLDVGFLCKNKKEGGSAGVSLVAALMPKSVPL